MSTGKNTSRKRSREEVEDKQLEEQKEETINNSEDEEEFSDNIQFDTTEDVSDDEQEDDDVYLSDDFEFEGEDTPSDFEWSDADEKDTSDEEVKVLGAYESTTDAKTTKELLELLQKEQEEAKKEQAPRPGRSGLFKDVDDADDSSEDEEQINTIGNVPLKWYEEYDHIGYTRDGKKILRGERKDTLDDLLARHDDPNYLRTVYDEVNGRKVILSNDDLKMILDIQKGRFPPGYDPYPDHVDWLKYDSRFPLVGTPTPKSKFTPNMDEHKKIIVLARKMKQGKGYPRLPKKEPEVYLMWGDDNRVIDDVEKHTPGLRAPKLKLPSNIQSYNPPPELIDSDDIKVYDALRKVPVYEKFVEEQFERCMNLYLAPRVVHKKKKIVNPEALLPQLPNPEELRPFPEILSLVYYGHNHIIRSISIDPTGRWMLSCADDHTLRLWEVDTGRCTRVWTFEGEMGEKVLHVEWNPNPELNLAAVAVDNFVYIIRPPESGTEDSNLRTLALFPGTQSEEGEHDIEGESKKGVTKSILQWKIYNKVDEKDKQMRSQGILCKLTHLKQVTQVTWHYRGDYFCSLSPDAYNDGVLIHQLSKTTTQKPFKKRLRFKGIKIQRVAFHPSKPLFFVFTKIKIRVYNLVKQNLVKKMKGMCKWISSVDFHPSGSHIVTGGYDKRVELYESDISSSPFKTLKYNEKAVRSVAFHKKYPLFATCSDEGVINIFHCTIHDDWMKDPTIVPVKILKGHRVRQGLGIMDIKFHPTHPWLFSAGADQTIRLFTS